MTNTKVMHIIIKINGNEPKRLENFVRLIKTHKEVESITISDDSEIARFERELAMI